MKSKPEMFTKKQRHEIYKKALAELCNTDYVCLAIGRVINNEIITAKFCEENLPEIWMCKNGDKDTYAFLSLHEEHLNDTSDPYTAEDCLNQRGLMLMFAIEMTRPHPKSFSKGEGLLPTKCTEV